MSAYGPFSDCPGLGNDEYPGFPADVCPEAMPDLSKHHSLLADTLKKDPGLYEKYRLVRTKLGVGLAKCIKTGADNRGHPMIKTVGLVAGDEYCYETFSQIFDRVIHNRHRDVFLNRQHVTDMDRNRLSTLRADGTGRYVLSTQIRAARCLSGVRFPPALAFNGRREAERVIVRALLEMDGALKGDYFPLPASQSYAPKPGGMSPEEEEELRKANLVFDQPDSTTTLCSGVGRHWPDARGVFVNGARSFSVWINEEEHLRAIAVRKGDAIQDAFLEMAEALDNISLSLRRHADCPDGFAFSSKFGFLTSCPSNLGTAMRISVILKLPLLAQQASLTAWCAKRRLTLRSAIDESGAQLAGVVEVSNCDRLGTTEVDAVNMVIEAVTELVLAEQRLEANGPGLEAAAEPGATTSTAKAGAEAPLAMSPTPSEQDNTNWDVAGNALGILFSCTVDGTPGKIDAPEALVSPRREAAPSSEDTAAAKIQAIQRGKAERRAVQKEKEEKTAAAAKIQAIQRGKKEREEVAKHKQEVNQAATKIQAIHRGKGVRKETNTRRSVTDNNVNDVRNRVRGLLEQCLDSGDLERVLMDMRSQREDGSRVNIDAVKAKAKAKLEGAVDSGELANILSEIRNEKKAVDSGEAELEDIRNEMKRMLEDACDTGCLSAALQDVKTPKNKKPLDTEAVREQMKDILVQAEESGALEAALRNVAATKPQAAATEDIRLHVKGLLEEAANSGALTDALVEVKGIAKETKAEEASLEDVRMKMKGMLEEACDSGSLADALLGLREDKEVAEADGLENIRLQMKDMLEAACDSGALSEALAVSKIKAPPSDLASRDPCRDLLAAFTHADEATLGTAGSMPLLLAVSNCDRRIGALNAMIGEVQRRIQDQEGYATQLEADIASSRQESAQLVAEYERQQRILDEADSTHKKLQDRQKKLFDDLDDEALKHRHCILDLDSMYSARSEISTVCTVRDLQSTDLHSPFSQATQPVTHLS